MEEKQERLDVLTAKYQGLFEFVGISEVTIEMHPRMITIGCKHNSQTTTYTTFGVFVRKFSPSVIMDYNRIITINNIIDE